MFVIPQNVMSTLLITVCVLTENPPVVVNHAGSFEGFYMTVYGEPSYLLHIQYTYSQDIRVSVPSCQSHVAVK
jgi:hypothetical protein